MTNDRTAAAGKQKLAKAIPLVGDAAEKSAKFSAFRAIDRNIYRRVKMYIMGVVIYAGKKPEMTEPLVKEADALGLAKEIALDIVEEFESTDVRRYMDIVRTVVDTNEKPDPNEIYKAIADICPATIHAGTAFSEEFLIQAGQIVAKEHKVLEIKEGGKITAIQNYVTKALSFSGFKSNAEYLKAVPMVQKNILHSYFLQEMKWREASKMRTVFTTARETLKEMNNMKYSIELIGEEPTPTTIMAVKTQYSTLQEHFVKVFIPISGAPVVHEHPEVTQAGAP